MYVYSKIRELYIALINKANVNAIEHYCSAIMMSESKLDNRGRILLETVIKTFYFNKPQLTICISTKILLTNSYINK